MFKTTPQQVCAETFWGFQNWKYTVRSQSAENNLPCSTWNYHNHWLWKEETDVSKTQEDQK